MRSFGLEMAGRLGSNGRINVLAVPFPGTD